MNRLINFTNVMVIVILFPSIGLSDMLSNIKESLIDVKKSIKTSHMVCIQDEYYPNRDIKGDDTVITPERRKVIQINGKTIIEEDTIIDCAKEKAKMVCSDLRDIHSLLKSNNLDIHFKRMLSGDRTTIIKGNYLMNYVPPGEEEPNNANIMLHKYDRPIEYILEMPYFGIIDINLIDEAYNPIITEVSQENKKLIQINISNKLPGGIASGIILCDPQIQYRFLSIVWTNDKGGKIYEVFADDYRDVNGFPYPFSYVRRHFVNGQLYSEETYNFQKVELNIPLNDLDFKILVPKMTPITDLAISNRVSEIGMERYMGIEDVLAICRNMAQNQ